MQQQENKKICLTCDKLFSRPTRISGAFWSKRKYCSNICRFKGVVTFGSKNPNWKGGKSSCILCTKQLAQRYSFRKTVYCRECWYGSVFRGDKCPNWKGGLTKKNQLIRTSAKYSKWRLSVFERDNFTCQDCGDNRGGNLEADHIKPFAFFPESRFLLENGRTLCKDCHRKTPTWGYGAILNNKKLCG